MSKKILACLLLFLAFVVAGLTGLLDRVPPVPLFSPGSWLFPEVGHAWGYQFFLSLLIDLCFYGFILYGIVSSVFWLFRRFGPRRGA